MRNEYIRSCAYHVMTTPIIANCILKTVVIFLMVVSNFETDRHQVKDGATRTT